MERRKVMNKKRLLIAVGITFVFAMAMFLAIQETGNAGECRIVRINLEQRSGGSYISMEPDTMHISKDTCVIWINWVPAHEVKVMFEEDGKKCKDATDAAVGFKMAENCYVTNFIPLGGTSSLRFNEEGTFNYAIEGSGDVKAEGSILVTK